MRSTAGAVLLALVLAVPGRVANAQDVKSRFIGTWRLVSIQGDSVNGRNRGGRPIGYIYYDGTGHMAVQIQPDRKRPSWPVSREPAADELAEAARGYTAYFGTWTVDEKARTITHHREGALNFHVVDYVRGYAFDGDRLTLSPLDRPGLSLVWERLKP
jgi:hypothetical protein